jgi:hypothetical protein
MNTKLSMKTALPMSKPIRIIRNIADVSVSLGNMSATIHPINSGLIYVTIRESGAIISEEYYGSSQDDADDLHIEQESPAS